MRWHATEWVWTRSLLFILFFVATAFPVPRAYAGVGVVLNETLDSSAEWITGSGHTAVYFSRICPESPIKLRLCGPGEEGSVMSNYTNLGEDERFRWNIVPLSVYLYGVQDARERPLFASGKLKALLEQRYRENVLPVYCESKSCMTSGKSEWREMVAAGMIRSMYIFYVQTTVQQDLDMIAKFNAMPNVNHFHGATNNCADFVKSVVNTYFPHSAHRDAINDFGISSPKAVSRTFTHYAKHHPELQFRVLHFAQLPGTIKRSTEPHSGTEQLYHSKKLLAPLIFVAPYEVPAIAGTYVLTGRFNPEKEFESHAVVSQTGASAAEMDAAEMEKLRVAQKKECALIVGTPQDWTEYRQQFDALLAEAIKQEIIPDEDYLHHFLKQLDQIGNAFADSNGALWMEISEGTVKTKVGVGQNDVLDRESDPRLSYLLLLARVQEEMKSPKHRRETMPEFKQDWAFLQYAHARLLQGKNTVITANAPPSPAPSAIVSMIGDN